MLKLCKIYACPNGTLGLHLSRAPWDPYPWVSGVQDGSNAYQAGVRSGDTVLELNGCDVLGQKILELANRIQNHWDQGGSFVSLLVWRNKTENNAINQQSLQKFAKCLQQVAQLLECPVCLEVVKPPGWQCCNGHVLCNSCRGRTVKCPICRVTLGPRGRCLLSDKLFTLLAESFPCDGVKNGNSSLERQKTYNNCHVGLPLISPKIDASSSPAQQKIHQKNQIVGRKISENITKSTGAKHPVFDDDNKVVLKLNQKSKKSHDFVEHGSCHHVHYHNHHSHLHRQASNSHQYKRQQLVHQGTFYCPTGKSSCSVMQDNVSTIVSTASIAISASNNLRSDPDSRTTDCVWTQDVGRKPKGVDGNRIDSVGVKLITEWDMLTHLTQIHKISVAQHYATFGQVVRLRLQVPHAKSIPCITIQSERTSTWDKENLRNHVILPGSTCSNTRTVCDGNREECVSTFFCNESSTERVQGHDLEKKCKNSRTTNTPKNIHRSSGQLFFVACIPLEDEATTAETETIRENEDEMEKERLRNEMNDMNADTRGDVRIVSTPCLQPKFDDCRAVVGAAIADTNTNTKARALPVFAVDTPNGPSTEVIKRATISKSTRQSTHSQTTGHFIRDLRSKFVSSTFLQQSRVNVENSANNPSDCTYCPKVDGSTSTWCNSSTSVMSSSSSSVSSSSTPSSSSSSCSSLSCSFSSSSSLPSLSRSWSIASLSVSNSSYGRCSNTLTQQHAIFIWYFGSEFDVKNFQTVIECKRTGLKWTGCVHPLTKSWSSIRQGLQQQIQLHLKQQTIDEEQHIQEQFLVVNSMPDGGDNFFDIAIKIK